MIAEVGMGLFGRPKIIEECSQIAWLIDLGVGARERGKINKKHNNINTTHLRHY